MSSAEAEYVAAARCCASILWMKSQLSDYDIHYKMSIVVAYDPFLSTDETEQCPLNEFLIKFLVLSGKRPLTLDFNTFCSSTGLDYNNGKYVAHPILEAVKKELGKITINPSYLEKTQVLKNSFPMAWRILFTFVIQVLGRNYSSTKQVNSIQQLLAYCLITGTEVDIWEIIYSDLVTKLLNKSRLKYVSYPRFISCALQVLLGSDYTQDENFRKKKKGKYQTVTSTLPQSQGPEALGEISKKRQKPKSKKPPTKPSTTIDPKDSVGNKQPTDTGLPSMTFDEGMAKTTPHPEGSLGDKDSGGNIPPADMEPIHPTVADLLGTCAKYQVDETQSTRLRYRSLIKNKGKTSSEVESNTKPLQLQTFIDVQSFLLFEDELDKESDEEEVLDTGEDMDEHPYVAEEV
ncbi:hypothetical protein Tco_0738281 [Tanacetum coccineum]